MSTLPRRTDSPPIRGTLCTTSLALVSQVRGKCQAWNKNNTNFNHLKQDYANTYEGRTPLNKLRPSKNPFKNYFNRGESNLRCFLRVLIRWNQLKWINSKTRSSRWKREHTRRSVGRLRCQSSQHRPLQQQIHSRKYVEAFSYPRQVSSHFGESEFQ